MAKKTRWLILFLLSSFFLAGCSLIRKSDREVPKMTPNQTEKVVVKDSISLPEPKKAGEISLEEAIQGRRSRRSFTDQPLSLDQISQILWAAQGITDQAKGFRAAPSAGALYPLEIYLVIKENGVKDLGAGVYRYSPENHSLQVWIKKDVYGRFGQACLDQEAVSQASTALVITADYQRTTGKYGERGRRYVEIEVGHVGQNIYLQAEGLGLGTCAIGAFEEGETKKLLKLSDGQEPLYVMPLGQPKTQ